jgi:hypothetical protein
MTRRPFLKVSAVLRTDSSNSAKKLVLPPKYYQLRDLDGNHIDQPTATAIAAALAVPDDVRRRARAHTQRGRLSQ